MSRLLVFAFLLVSSLSSCYYLGGKRVRGNGNITSEERSFPIFDEVDVSGAIDVHISQGELRPVRIEADENLLEYIEVRTSGHRLDVHTRRGYNLRPTRKIKVYVTAPDYRKLEVSGACNIIGDTRISQSNPLSMEVSGAGDIRMDVNTPQVAAKISGSGNVDMKGETQNFELRISGAGDANCYDLRSENTEVRISGAGEANVYASVLLDAHVSGAGSIRYKGNAAKVNQQVSGAGSVKKAD